MFRTVMRFAAVIAAPAVLLAVLVAGSAMAVPSVTTDQPDYGSFDLVTITGKHFLPNQSLDVVVVRPDATIVTGDGTDTPGFDSVTADAANPNAFTYGYQLFGYASGTYTVNVYDSADTGHATVLATTTFTDGKASTVTFAYRDFGFGSPVEISLVGSKIGFHHFAPGDDDNHDPIIVAAGDTFTVDEDSTPPTLSVGPEIEFLLYNPTTTLSKTIKIHTSCSAPIGVGFLYGDSDPFADDPSLFDPPGSLTAGVQITALTTHDCGTLAEAITVCKDVEPDDASTWDFTLTGPTGGSATGLGDGDCHVFTDRTPGSYTLTETTQVEYSTAVACDSGKGSNSTSSISFSLLDDEENVTCTFTNTKSGDTFNVLKDFVPNSAASVTVSLSCASGTATPASASASEGSPATFTIIGATGDPNCTATESPIPAGYTSSGTCAALLSTASCTITNTLNSATFTVNKDFSDKPSNDTTTVSVTLDCGTNGTIASTNPQNVSEASPGSWTVTGISGSTTCTASESPIPSGYTASGCTSAVTLSANGTASCTITNTLNSATFTVNKDFSDKPSNDTTTVSVTLDCGTNGTIASTNPQNVSEASPGSWTVTGISGSTTCTASESPIPSGYTASGCTSAVTLSANGTASCTITNTVPPLTHLTVEKVCVPTGDPGLFNLLIDGNVEKANAACGTGTGQVTVSPGTRVVSETAGTGTDLGDYTSVISGDCDSSGNVTLVAGDDKTCTITNDSTPPTLTVKKICVPANDPGLFNLRIDGNVEAADAACGDDTGPVVVAIGAHTVDETASTGTDLATYTTTVIGGACNSAGNVTLAAGQNKTCTITNTVGDPPVGGLVEIVVPGAVGGDAGTGAAIIGLILIAIAALLPAGVVMVRVARRR